MRCPRTSLLAIVPPDSKLPPEEIANLFAGLVRKNNLLILTGEKSFDMPRLWDAAKLVYAAGQAKAQKRVDSSSPQWKEFEELETKFAQQFNGVLKSIFDKLLLPTQRPGKDPVLEPRPLEQAGDTNDGEGRVEATLIKDPKKLFTDWSQPSDFAAVIGRQIWR